MLRTRTRIAGYLTPYMSQPTEMPEDDEIVGISRPDRASLNILSFDDGNGENATGGIVLVSENVRKGYTVDGIRTLIGVREPKLTFVKVVGEILSENEISNYSFRSTISNSAFVHSTAHIDPTGCVIGDDVIIAENVIIRSGVSVGNGSRIGPNCVVGETGFGYVRENDGRSLRFPHLAGVDIGMRVDIGALCCIDRGSLSNTTIGDDAKINNLSMLGHGVKIGKSTYIHAGCTVSGGSTIGEYSWLGPNSSVNNKRKVGDNVLVGTSSVVTKDIPSGVVYAGNPARYIRDNGH